jgi:mannosyltransferase
VALTVGAGLLATARLGARSFWLDEAYTASTIDRGFGDLVALTWRDEGYQILHQLVLWPLGRVTLTEFWLRAPSALAYVVTVPVLMTIGRRHFGAWVGFVAAAIYALNGFAIVLAQEARSYPFATLAATLALDAFLRARHGSTPWWWMLWATVAVWFHGFAFLAVAAPLVTVVAEARADRTWIRRWLPPVLAFCVAIALPLFLPWQHTNVSNDYAFLADLSFGSIRDLGFTLLGRSGVAVITLAVAGAAGTFVAWRDRDASLAPVLAMAILPAFALGAISLVEPILLDRYVASSLPAIALVAACGAVRVAPSRYGPLICAVVLVGSSLGASRAVSRPPLEDWRGATRTLAAEAEVGDVLLLSVDEELVALEYYAPHFPDIRNMDLAWPDAEWGSFATGDQGPTALDESTAVAAIGHEAAPPRIWIVDAKAAPGRVDEIVTRLLTSIDGYGRLAEYRFDGIRVVVLGQLAGAP